MRRLANRLKNNRINELLNGCRSNSASNHGCYLESRSGRHPGITLLLIVALGAYSFPVFAERSVPVRAAEAKIIKLWPQSWVAGAVISKKNVIITAQTAGYLDKRAKPGQQLKKGELVAQLNNHELELQRVAQLALLQQQQARRDFLRQEVRRLEKLVKTSHSSKTQLEALQADLKVANSKVVAEQARLKVLQSDQKQLQIPAPFAGVVFKTMKDPGAWINTDDAVLQLVDTHNIEIQIFVSETVARANDIGDSVVVEFENSRFNGVITVIMPVMRLPSRLREMRISMKPLNTARINSNEKMMMVGAAVKVRVARERAREVLAVLRDAIVIRSSGMAVFRITADQKAERVPVQLGLAADQWVEVIGDIKAGDQMVIRGNERLRPGLTVSVKK